ncbi:class I SAM-dependent methyltransferase [Roseovarius mucosus]|uniref:class I SAM-dependent methyltransferase n=1 Tax=Roseovarius mucosus TaxID=215743 RepID=UPI003BAD79AE
MTISETLRLSCVKDLRVDPLDYVLDHGLCQMGGLWLEFGVFKGTTIKKLARCRSSGKVYGFDSFEGLPEKWERGYEGWWSEKGAFSLEGALPKVPGNVELVKGWFDETIGPFLERVDGEITLMHIDCDLYSSTKTIFDQVRHRISDKCVVIFDEIFNYPGWHEHEALAFAEFLQDDCWDFSWIGMNGVVEFEPTKSVAAHQSAALILRRKKIAVDYDIVHGSFFTANYEPPNTYLVDSLSSKSALSDYKIKFENTLLSDDEFQTDGVRAFQRGNTVKWRLLIDCVERHLNTGVLIVFTDSDAEFTGPLDSVVADFLASGKDFGFQGQFEGVSEEFRESAFARWKADVNIGFLICHATQDVLDFLKRILEHCDFNRKNNVPDNPSQEVMTTGWDQMVINEVLNREPDIAKWYILPLHLVGKRGVVFAHHLAKQKEDFLKKAQAYVSEGKQ